MAVSDWTTTSMASKLFPIIVETLLLVITTVAR